ncbi:MAG: DNA-processing protein DprA [Desulfovibrionaceae bacterium]|nr:DNA-processing protein DprA [Desulfovibrionaceae bacterium]
MGHPQPPGSVASPESLPGPSPVDADQEFKACLALRHSPGIGPKTWKRLFSAFPSAREACRRHAEWTQKRLVDTRAAEAYARGRYREAARAEYDAARGKGLRFVTFFDPCFPDPLRHIPDPPLLLYVVGDVSLLKSPAVAMVGARQCSRYGFDAAMRLGRDLARAGVAVVSGLAHGIDRQAHLAGLSEVGGSIAVLGTGIDLVYPDSNMDVWKALAAAGLIVSEFPPGAHPCPGHFPVRNRIISGLSLGVAVIEAAGRSGSLITARLALEQGREVFALPGPVHLPTFEGCHKLIKEGALLVQNGQDILEALAPRLADYVRQPARHTGAEADAAVAGPDLLRERPAVSLPPSLPPERVPPPGADAVAPAPPPASLAPPPPPADLTDLERSVLGLFTDGKRLHMDAVAQELGLASHMVSRTLVGLELKGLVRKWPGMYYGLEQMETPPPCKNSR